MSLLNSYIKKEGRVLPVYLLIDTSGSMRGQKIESVNVALKEMLNSFKKINHPKGVIEVCILSFHDDVIDVVKPLSKIQDDEVHTLSASGLTPMGKCFETVTQLVEDESKLPTNAYIPTLVLISDGLPTDYPITGDSPEEIAKWSSLNTLLTSRRTSVAVKLAMSIGDDANKNILRAFINNPEIPVISAKDNETIAKFFNWVTKSVSVRSVSANPNVATVEDVSYFDDDEIEF